MWPTAMKIKNKHDTSNKLQIKDESRHHSTGVQTGVLDQGMIFILFHHLLVSTEKRVGRRMAHTNLLFISQSIR